jgi:hypothetical protein
MNRLFDEPLAVFNEQMLKPELQGMDDYVDGINNIVEAQQKVAKRYFEEGSIDGAIPPLKILLHIMAYGEFEGKEISHPDLRKYFDRDYVINSDWYKERLKLKQEKDVKFHIEQIAYLESFASKAENVQIKKDLDIDGRLAKAKDLLAYANSEAYLKDLEGTIGADVIYRG